MRTAIFPLVVFTMLPPLVHAHHSAAAEFDVTTTETIEGKFASLEFRNPHVKLFIDVTNDSGEVEQWLVAGPGKLSLAERGWTADMFAAGESITAVGNPLKTGGKAIWLKRIIM